MSEEYSEGQRRLLTDARLGIELRQAKQTVFYQWIVETARLAALTANEELVKADPTKWENIARLQGDVRRFYDIEAWLNDAIQRGEQAEAAFNAEQSAG